MAGAVRWTDIEDSGGAVLSAGVGGSKAFRSGFWAGLAPCGLFLWYMHKAGDDAWQQAGYGMLTLCALLILGFSSERSVNRPLDRLWQLVDGLERLSWSAPEPPFTCCEAAMGASARYPSARGWLSVAR